MSKSRKGAHRWGIATIRRELHEELGSPPSYKLIVFKNDIILVPGLPHTRVSMRWHLRAWLLEVRIPPAVFELLRRNSIEKPPKHYVKPVAIIPQVPACYVMKNVLMRYFEVPHKYELFRGLLPISFTQL